MAIKRGDIVIAVHADLGKPRPAVVVQADEFNERALTILVCPLTTEVIENLPLRPILSAGSGNGLQKRSQIMTDKMLALHRGRVRDVLGSIDSNTREQLNQALLMILGLDR